MTLLPTTYRYGRLVKKAQNGDEEAFRKLYERTNQKLFAYAASRCKSREDAIDLVEETFVDLWRALSSFIYYSDSEFTGFLFLILKRKLIRYYQQQKDTASLEDDILDPTPPPKHDEYGVHELLSKLRPEYRDVLELRYWSGLHFNEIASTMEEKTNTIKTWHRRALKELTTLLHEHE